MPGMFDQGGNSAFSAPSGIDPMLLMILTKMQQGPGAPGMGTPGPGTPIPPQPGTSQPPPPQQNSGAFGGNAMLQQLFGGNQGNPMMGSMAPSATSGMAGMNNQDITAAIQRAMQMLYGTSAQSGSGERGF